MSIISTVPKGAAVEGINPNLLRNWYFVGGGTGRGVFPVNSRGASSYDTFNYSVDGWKIDGNATVTCTSSYLYLALKSGQTNYAIIQKIPDFNKLDGKQVTVSVLYGSGLVSGTATINMSNNYTYIYSNSSTNFDFISDNINRALYIRRTNSTPVTIIYAVKLELGDQQTLAHQENGVWVLNEIPDYEYELYRCKTSTADPSDTHANKVLSTNIPNKNLLDNWYLLNSVNQRGQSSYSTDGAYTIDRWKLGGAAGTASVSNQGVLLTSSTAISQFFEQSRVMSGKTYTISILWSNGLSVATGTLTHGTQTSGWQIAVGTVTTPRSCGIRVFNSNTFQIAIFGDGTNRVIAVKVELGTEQTLAHQENGAWVLNEIPDYGEEWNKCRRYLRVYRRETAYTNSLMLGPHFSHESRSGYAQFAVTIDPPMVSVPTVTNNSALGVRTITVAANMANVTFSFVNTTRNILNIKAESTNITEGTLYWVDSVNQGNSLILSSEL